MIFKIGKIISYGTHGTFCGFRVYGGVLKTSSGNPASCRGNKGWENWQYQYQKLTVTENSKIYKLKQAYKYKSVTKMTKKEFEAFLRKNDRKVRNAMNAIEESSKEFERIMARIKKGFKTTAI